MSLWLTKIELNPRNPQLARTLNDPVALHRTTMRLFDDDLGAAPRQRAGVLFRLEEDRDNARLLVQSRQRPQPEKLADRWATGIQVKPIEGILEHLTVDRTVHYRLVGSPVRRISKRTPSPTEDRRPGQVIPLSGDDAIQWWHRKASDAGLRVLTVEGQSQSTRSGVRRAADGKKDRVAATQHRFEGQAVIVDPDALRTALVEGIGRGKSYGCGLLSLAPVR